MLDLHNIYFQSSQKVIKLNTTQIDCKLNRNNDCILEILGMHDQGSLTVTYSLRFTEAIKVIMCMVDKNTTENFPTVWKHKHFKIRPSRWWDARLLLLTQLSTG